MVRKELREHIFKMLFQIEFNDPQEMPEQIEYYFLHWKMQRIRIKNILRENMQQYLRRQKRLMN